MTTDQKSNCLLCMNCGNRDRFTKEVTYREWVTEKHVMEDTADNVVEFLDHDTNDSEFVEEENPVCDRCQSEYVICEKEDRIIEEQVKHTSKKGKWYTKALPESKWNKELLKELVARRL